MSSVNLGSQIITYQYQDPAVSAKFNTITRDFVRPGIYKGGLITILTTHTIGVSPFVASLRSNDLSDNQSVRCQTQSSVTVTIPNGPSQTYTVYLTYSYAASPTNYADFNIRLSSAPPVSNEVRICNVTNDGAGLITSVNYNTRMRGTVDVDLDDRLTTDIDPTQDYHVGNRAYNDLRYINHNGPSTWDIQVLKTGDGTLDSRIWFDGTASRDFELQDRSGTLALHYEAFRLGMIQASLENITASVDAPWLNISLDHVTLSTANWPLLVPFLRGIGTTGYVVTGYTPGVSTILQMDNTDPATEAFVLALYEDNLYHGDGVENYANYKTLTVAVAFGVDIPAGEYNIVDIDPVLFTIEIDASTVGPSAAGNVNHHPFRIKASSTTARWFRVEDSTIVTSGSTENIPMFRLRDRIQTHRHLDATHSHNYYQGCDIVFTGAVGNPFVFGVYGPYTYGTSGSSAEVRDPADSVTIGIDPVRQGNTSRPRSLVAYKYIYGDVYTP